MKKKTILGLPISVLALLVVTVVGAGALVSIYWVYQFPSGAVTLLGVSGWVTASDDAGNAQTYDDLLAHTPIPAPDITVNFARDAQSYCFIVSIEACDEPAPSMLIELVDAPSWVTILQVQLVSFDTTTKVPTFTMVENGIGLQTYEFVMETTYFPMDQTTTLRGYFVWLDIAPPVDAPRDVLPLEIDVSVGVPV